uniref:Serine protease sat autotransporter, Serine protease sat translocator]) n=1 Tax=Ganoderma boninense TaxID=34458 RepID=A0A5K1JUH6_9APHY|nr:Serine protease sat autotransporter (EC [Cleaved into: Serine protease sat (Secreted autotransporter toxin sat), Serine protease sat translocator] [Ganoderma boninense]
MTGPSARPRRSNANTKSAAVVIAAKQTRRSSDDREAKLDAIHKLELELEAKAQQHAEAAAHPPPVQSATPSTKKGHIPSLGSAPSSATATPTPPFRATTGTSDSVGASGVYTQSTGTTDLDDLEDSHSALVECLTAPALRDVAVNPLGDSTSAVKTKGKQKLSEYRNGVANEAVDVVTAYLLSKHLDTAEDRAEYVAWALSPEDNWPFRFERVVEVRDGEVQKIHGAYQSTVISRTFAYHLKRINVRGEQIRDHPCNALALVTTAVECALKMWATGSLVHARARTEDAKFSERLWGKTANEYLGGIIALTDEQWDNILAEADLSPPTTGRAMLKDADLEELELAGEI